MVTGWSEENPSGTFYRQSIPTAHQNQGNFANVTGHTQNVSVHTQKPNLVLNLEEKPY
jgi:hypothetical protein